MDSHLLDKMKSKTVGEVKINGEMRFRKKAAIKKEKKKKLPEDQRL